MILYIIFQYNYASKYALYAFYKNNLIDLFQEEISIIKDPHIHCLILQYQYLTRVCLI
jgi:hypothetical protein